MTAITGWEQQPPLIAPAIGFAPVHNSVGLPSGELNVKQFAVGDGVTDDRANILAALAEADANGQDVYFPPGDYFTTGNFFTYSNMKVRGAGISKTRILLDPTKTITVWPLGTVNPPVMLENWTLEDMTLDGQVQISPVESHAAGMVNGYAFKHLTFRRVKFCNARGYGLGLEGFPLGAVGKAGPQEDLLVEDCIFDLLAVATTRTLVLVNAIDDNDTSVTVDDWTQLDATGGTLLVGEEYMTHGTVSSNTFGVTRGQLASTAVAHDAGVPLYRVASGDGVDIKSGLRHTFRHCHFSRCPDKGLNPRARFTTIEDCHFDYCQQGIGPNALGDEEDIWTNLNGALNSSATTITVDSTTAFPTAGTGLIDSESITWTGKTGTTFTGVTRGALGTTATTHDDNTAVGWNQLDVDHDVYMTITGGSAHHCATGIAMSSGQNSTSIFLSVEGFHATQNTTGMNFAGGATGAERATGRGRVTVRGCTANNNTGIGMQFTQLEDLIVTGNICYGNDVGIKIIDQPNGGLVTANAVRGNTTFGYLEQGNVLGMRTGEQKGAGSATPLFIAADTTATARVIPETAARTQQFLSIVVVPTWSTLTPADGTSATANITFTGVGRPDALNVGYNAQLAAGVSIEAFAIATSNIRLTMWNRSGGGITIDPAISVRVYATRVITS